MVLVAAIATMVPGPAWPAIFTLGIFVFCYFVVLPRWRFTSAMKHVPGPPALPLLGNALILTGGQDDFFCLLHDCAKKYGEMFVLWVGQRPFVFLQSAEAVQPILSSTLHINKSYEYSFLYPWVGTGLITSTGSKWHARRKLLTPSFHSQILDDFVAPAQRGARVFAQRLAEQQGKEFDIVPLAKLCTLDMICDTVMGRNANAQLEANSDYVTAIAEISGILQRRFITPWLKPDLLFRLSSSGRRQARCLDVIHGFTNRVIQERREELQRCAKMNGNLDVKNGLSKTGRPRLALLDLLLELAQAGAPLSDNDIREEVNTFLFAGHDTVASGISWCLYAFGSHSDVQAQIADEVREVLADSPDGSFTLRAVQRLTYLDCCIREAMRLFPVAPLIARDIQHPIQIGKSELPAGVTVLMNLYLLHRDPRFFPEPNCFKPERFLSSSKQPHSEHPYCYVPFSAGSRNCIGQKFAMMEMKIILAEVLLNFQVQAVTPESELRLLGELVLLNKDGVKLKLTPRSQVSVDSSLS